MRRAAGLLLVLGLAACSRATPTDLAAQWEAFQFRSLDALDEGDTVRARAEIARFRGALAEMRPEAARPYEQAIEAIVEETAARESLEFGATELALDHLARAQKAVAHPSAADEARWTSIRASVASRLAAETDGGPRIPMVAFARVPGGRWEVGTPTDELGRNKDLEGEPRAVAIEEFWIARTEVTREAWTAHGGAGGADRTPGDEWLPASNVGHAEAQAWCEGLSKVDPTFAFSLPNEAEWEVACRATRPSKDGPVALGPWESGPRPKGVTWKFVLETYAVYDPHNRTTADSPNPVASRAPNPLGLYDMHGNVHEWCLRAEGVGFGYPDIGREPTRGGSFADRFELCRAGARGFHSPDKPKLTVGFRVIARKKS